MLGWNQFPIFIASVKGSKRIPIVKKELARLGIEKYHINEQTPPLIKTQESICISCTDNHLQIYTKGIKHPYICVFEDDIFISDVSRLEKVLDDIRVFLMTNVDWDFLYLGHFPWEIGKKVSESIHTSISWCTHAYLISQRGMKFMLSYTPETIMKIGRLAVPVLFDYFFKEGGGIDTFIAWNVSQGKLRSYAVIPMLVEQYSIPRWSQIAKFTEKVCILLPGWWPKNVLIFGWIIYWLVVWVISKRTVKK